MICHLCQTSMWHTPPQSTNTAHTLNMWEKPPQLYIVIKYTHQRLHESYMPHQKKYVNTQGKIYGDRCNCFPQHINIVLWLHDTKTWDDSKRNHWTIQLDLTRSIWMYLYVNPERHVRTTTIRKLSNKTYKNLEKWVLPTRITPEIRDHHTKSVYFILNIFS